MKRLLSQNLVRFLALICILTLSVGVFACNATPTPSTGSGESSLQTSEQGGESSIQDSINQDSTNQDSSIQDTPDSSNQDSSTQEPEECEHQVVIDEAVQPSCGKTGLTEGSHCGVCGEVLVAQEIVDALSHNFVGATCSICGESLEATANEYFDFHYSNFLMGYEIKAKDINNMPENVCIPATYEGVAVVEIQVNAFKGCTLIKNVVIPDGIKNIAGRTFEDCVNLESVYMSNGVETVGGGTFDGCTNLKTVVLSEKLTVINQQMFYECVNLQNLTIPSTVKSIGQSAFCKCESLTRMVLPEGLTTIDYNAFYMCKNLASITLPSTLTSVGNEIFYACNRLVEIINKSDVELTVGKLMAKHGAEYVLEVHSGDSKLTTKGDFEFIAHDGVNYLTKYIGDNKEVVLPQNYNGESYKIHSFAFYYQSEITSVVVPNGVTAIGEYAFEGCSSIQSMVLPFVGGSIDQETASKQSCFGFIFGAREYEGAQQVKQFYSSTKSANAYIPSSLTSVTVNGGSVLYGAFYNCSMITSLTFGEGVTSLGDRALYECSALTSVSFGKNLASIGERAFMYCNNLAIVYYGASEEAWAGVTVGKYNTALENAEIVFAE